MKLWHLIVTALYVLALALLALPIFAVSIGLEGGGSLSAKVFGSSITWAWLGVMGAGQLVMLLVPLRLSAKRPVTRGALWPTVLLGATIMMLLALAAAVSIHAAILGDNQEKPWEVYAFAALAATSWLFWALLFRRLASQRPPADFLSRLCQRLFQGSILELLVAVPCHVVVRQRTDCCAGVFTMFGLAMGVSVMLLAFGPAVYFLFVARAQRLQAALPPPPEDPTTESPSP